MKIIKKISGENKKTDEPKYSKKWFNPNNFDKYLKKLGKKKLHFLEIGSFEGLSTNYFLDNFLTDDNSKITCIDPWMKYSESTITNMKEWDDIINEKTYEIFIKNTEKNKNKIIIKRGLSKDIIPTLEDLYDFIYIDGDHSVGAVWLDATQSFEKLKTNGIIIFDDYKWNSGNKSPEKAINRFMIRYFDKIKVLGINHQVIIQKISPIKSIYFRIIFLIKKLIYEIINSSLIKKLIYEEIIKNKKLELILEAMLKKMGVLPKDLVKSFYLFLFNIDMFLKQ